MSVIRPESVRVIGQGGNAPRMSDAAAAAVAEDAEYRLRLVIQVSTVRAGPALAAARRHGNVSCGVFTREQEARKFMQHSKRSTMRAQDINHSLRMLNVDVSGGWGG